MIFSKDIILESHKPQNNLDMDELQRVFKVAKVVDSGIKTNGENEKLHFIRIFFISHSDEMFTVEFRSKTSDMQLIHSSVIYNVKNNKDLTIYADGDKAMSKFVELVKERIPVGTGMLPVGEASIAQGAQRAQIISLMIGVITSLILLVSYGLWLGRRYKIDRDERDSYEAEKKLNAFLFKGQTKEEPAFRVYSDITQHIDNVVNGGKRSLILYGKPGASKTYLVRRSLHFSKLQPGKDYAMISGSAGDPRKSVNLIYETLWTYKDQLIVFDDFDSVLDNDEAINLLKAAMDSYPVRIISMPTSGGFEEQKLPKRFVFSGNIIIITNKTEIAPALLSRATGVKIDFTSDEFKDHIKQLLKFISPQTDMAIKEEVFEYVCKQKNVTIDFRRFGAIVDIRVANPAKWKDLARGILSNK
jgi:hypothetical protein